MLSAIAFIALIVCYFSFERSDTPVREAILAMLLYSGYLIVYLLVPPFANGTSTHMGQLYGLVPIVSLAAILFPYFNHKSPEIVTRVLGWFGLTIVAFILLCFKLFVW
ncbi:hypothetical protein TUM4438_15620 [Shewanella sairae]|uniref:Uncharacterized protein n=1 Tax=Shewanella sairae TaxID=190310 RepID=A0ABQ4PA71_9GAMM|nr:hypothetical protein [Shewanella sairae]MCL1128238.1 hypothetical protein [Shewanella sairae]GIU44434.1 hypothetical protein TUM4438_15620 [Shewanella sairae]